MAESAKLWLPEFFGVGPGDNIAPAEVQLAEEEGWMASANASVDELTDHEGLAVLGTGLGWDEQCSGMYFPVAKLGSVAAEGSGGSHSDLTRATWLSGGGTILGE